LEGLWCAITLLTGVFSVLTVPDEIIIGFISAVILGLVGAVVAMWKTIIKDRDDNDKKGKK
jgi:uncharacterized membrane protein YeaQ/YmgE (transglycosylase-associated protein family)